MALVVKGTTVKSLVVNGTTCKKGICNGVTVFEKVDPLTLYPASGRWSQEHGSTIYGILYVAQAANGWFQCSTTWAAGTYDTLTITYGGNSLNLYWFYAGGGASGYIGLPTTADMYTTTTKKVSVPANACQLWLRYSIPSGGSVGLHSAVLSKS